MAVVRKLVAAIRREDPERLIIADGLQWGTVPVPELRELHIAQATRGYTPMEISHYGASWVNGANFPYSPMAARAAAQRHAAESPQARRLASAGDRRPFRRRRPRCGCTC